MSKARFAQEAKAGSKLSHPNLVTVFDYGFAGDEPYLVMEFVEGESLNNLILKQGKIAIALDAFIDIFTQVSKGVQYIHKNGIIHRDLKTSNIIVQTIDGESYVKLLDFGIAKILTDGQSPQQHLIVIAVQFMNDCWSPFMVPNPRNCIWRFTMQLRRRARISWF
ncbi:MAG: serine/threonine protein kinase [Candidatus Obscuribacterales bacterium]|nr:serine/threonine protein kinase [Candidatus Obscuribacterales bacterium]